MQFITNFNHPVNLSIKKAKGQGLFSSHSWSGKKKKGKNSCTVSLITDTWPENMAAMLPQCTALAKREIFLVGILPYAFP